MLCLRDDIRMKMEEKLAEAIECRQIAKNTLKRIACKYEKQKNQNFDYRLSSRNEQKENDIDDESKVTLNDINQLKTRVKLIGITFSEMSAIQVY